MSTMTTIKPTLSEDDTPEKDGDKIEPRPPDDDGGDEIEAEFIPDENGQLCTWSESKDEWRRVFVFKEMATSDLAGNILVENMDAVCKWLKDGSVPRKLKAVKGE